MLPQLYRLCEQYGDKTVKFVMVYILEAHATDEWPIGNIPEGVPRLDQHTNLPERLQAAQLFQRIYGSSLHPSMSMVVDGPANAFNKAFPSWPFRVWMIDDRKVLFKGMTTDNGDNLDTTPLEDLLRDHVGY